MPPITYIQIMASLNEFKDDSEAVTHWQKTSDPQLLAELMIRFRPTIHSAIGRYSTTGMNPIALKAIANDNTIKALSVYDPSKGTVPNTHIFGYLKKLQRSAQDSLTSGSMPEHRSMKMAQYSTMKQSHIDQYGREPSMDETAEELGWSHKEVERMEKELGGEVAASKAESDFFGHSTAFEHQDRALADLFYLEAHPKDKVIMEHTFGIGGKPILTNKEIATKLGTYEMDITRSKRKISKQITGYRTV